MIHHCNQWPNAASTNYLQFPRDVVAGKCLQCTECDVFVHAETVPGEAEHMELILPVHTWLVCLFVVM